MVTKSKDKALQRIEAALAVLGIVFCPICETPHNTRSREDTDLDGWIAIQLLEGEFVHLCAGCTQNWLTRHRASVQPRKLGFALASWILDRKIYHADHPLHETAIAFARTTTCDLTCSSSGARRQPPARCTAGRRRACWPALGIRGTWLRGKSTRTSRSTSRMSGTEERRRKMPGRRASSGRWGDERHDA